MQKRPQTNISYIIDYIYFKAFKCWSNPEQLFLPSLLKTNSSQFNKTPQQ